MSQIYILIDEYGDISQTKVLSLKIQRAIKNGYFSEIIKINEGKVFYLDNNSEFQCVDENNLKED